MEAAERASPPQSSDLAPLPGPAATVTRLNIEALSPHAQHPRSGAHTPSAPGTGELGGDRGTLLQGAQDLSASAWCAAVAVTQGAGEGAELELLTAVLEQGG